MFKNRSILYLAILFGTMRIILLFVHNPNLIMNIDEESNYEVATNHYKGRGYTYFDPEKNAYLPTAFHASFTIFVYEILLENKIHKRYWVGFCHILSGILLAFSVFYFFELAKIFMPEKQAYYCCLIYCIFPSIIYYIGSLFWYEQMVLSLLVMVFYWIIKSIRSKISIKDFTILTLCIIISSLFRIQTIALFVPLLLTLIIYFAIKKQFKSVLMYLVIAIVGILSHYPSLKKNKLMYGSYILSTQMGFEILQGHNPHARGSWMGDWLLPESKLYQYSHEKIPHIHQLNQYEEGLARKKVAIKWIKENPLSELKLMLRKIVLFFLPRNFEFLPFNQFFNPINFIIYSGFIFYVLLSLKDKKLNWNIEKLIILTPILGALTLTIIFFMGARWRYYAEPFMIIFALMAWQETRPFINLLKNKFDGFQK
jgi:hypothetical protein